MNSLKKKKKINLKKKKENQFKKKKYQLEKKKFLTCNLVVEKWTSELFLPTN